MVTDFARRFCAALAFDSGEFEADFDALFKTAFGSFFELDFKPFLMAFPAVCLVVECTESLSESSASEPSVRTTWYNRFGRTGLPVPPFCLAHFEELLEITVLGFTKVT